MGLTHPPPPISPRRTTAYFGIPNIFALLSSLPRPPAARLRFETLSPVFFSGRWIDCFSLSFYYLKLKQPISCLQNGIMRIQNNDLDFSLPILSNDEMGQLCAFEEMRSELLKSNRLLLGNRPRNAKRPMPHFPMICVTRLRS